jgi:hypothetical protein
MAVTTHEELASPQVMTVAEDPVCQEAPGGDEVTGSPSSPLPGRGWPAGPSAEPPEAPLPVRRPARDRPAQAERPGGPGEVPTAEVLRQVLNGLRKLR